MGEALLLEGVAVGLRDHRGEFGLGLRGHGPSFRVACTRTVATQCYAAAWLCVTCEQTPSPLWGGSEPPPRLPPHSGSTSDTSGDGRRETRMNSKLKALVGS